MAALGTRKDTKPVFVPVQAFFLVLRLFLAREDISGVWTG